MPMATQTPKPIPLAQWAAKNKVSKRTAQRMVRDGRLPTVQIPTYIVGVMSDFKVKK